MAALPSVAASILNDTVSTVAAAIAKATTSSSISSTAKEPNFMVRMTEQTAIDPLSHVGDGIFLQTKTAQGIAGAFVWVALFLTCQQVCALLLFIYFSLNASLYNYFPPVVCVVEQHNVFFFY